MESTDLEKIKGAVEIIDLIPLEMSKSEATKKGGGKPVEVHVAYKINCVTSINPIMSDYEIDVKIFFFWFDKKAIGLPQGSIDKALKKLLFAPDVFISNEHNLEIITHDTRVIDSEMGEIKCSMHYRGTVFIADMHLGLFPFDYQDLTVEIRPKKLDEGKVIFIPKHKDECAFDNHNIHEWDVINHFMEELRTDPALSTTKKIYSTIHIIVQVRRQPGWFINNVMVTAFLLVSFAWLTFLMGSSDRDAKLDIITNIIIASIANKFVVQDQIPKVSYRTLVDTYIDLCFFSEVYTTVSVYVVDMVYVRASEIEGGDDMVGYINAALFISNFLVFVGFHFWLYFKLRNLDRLVESWKNRANNQENVKMKIDSF